MHAAAPGHLPAAAPPTRLMLLLLDMLGPALSPHGTPRTCAHVPRHSPASACIAPVHAATTMDSDPLDACALALPPLTVRFRVPLPFHSRYWYFVPPLPPWVMPRVPQATCLPSGLPVALKVYFLSRVPNNVLHTVRAQLRAGIVLLDWGHPEACLALRKSALQTPCNSAPPRTSTVLPLICGFEKIRAYRPTNLKIGPKFGPAQPIGGLFCHGLSGLGVLAI